ncbi:peptide-methionine (S)-S-oxide reductase MsrA [Commensalibacter papalotli (ex Botero et al. 2024)]|uniref:Peptide methionine sulfoxide reductase MsrA n=1 Tax=Commensalibacter papalotli (ex Botero et al. 2024) TaxID=2972766 RepID=A0ABN8W6L9_9PROT|nr:peptide-methionine (S)-S-oxide reductase MsrA [Commensalibacter papalotli (ex Botero et al. 2024)]CAI3923537.1 Peptide methionine sulfoxide reductase MsrA (MsrA) (PDB:1FF3) [Commensalibacter papalotli (ex Botero et al. 2024)]CAI3928576.1 Peptide methionine sulfoxide reductase MsrA (MsrA) (PDB:1FF3) [Commensalibacter papalotli (ex Botero et al. 2024)]
MKDEEYIETVVIGGGCFWCVEAMLSQFKGIKEIMPGYAGGHTENPTYKQVYTDLTGHAEVVKISFDTRLIMIEDIFRIFFLTHDPTTLNAQGADVGTRYRSVILPANKEQEKAAILIKNEIEKADIWDKPIVTEIKKLDHFYPAEIEHKNYFELHPEVAYCQAVIAPKVLKVRKEFTDYLKK